MRNWFAGQRCDGCVDRDGGFDNAGVFKERHGDEHPGGDVCKVGGFEFRVAVRAEWARCLNVSEREQECLRFGGTFEPFEQVGSSDAGVCIPGDVLDGQGGGERVGADNLVGVGATRIEQKSVQG